MTGRGKHVGRFSYYHIRLTSRLSSVQAFLEATRNRLYQAPFDFNVVKLDWHSRISFLLYQDFTEPFPALLKALSCDFALGHFGKRKPYSELPERLQRDVRIFFGSITKARAAGKRALFAVGDKQRLTEAALFCHDELGIGLLHQRHDLTFHQSLLGECLPLIRIYVGCALQLFGDATSVDLIKVHLESGKVPFLVYDDFEGEKTPKLVERIKVDLPPLRVDFFDYVGEYEPVPLEEERTNFYLR